ncbi:MAG: membrane-bound lytic murein transglycosylase MltF [Rhodocyclaceae bacterium]
MRWIFHLSLIFLLAACGEQNVPPVHEAKELVILTRSGPTTYSVDETRGAVGFDHDLAKLFAEELGLKARFVVAASDADILQRLKKKEAHLAAAWLIPVDDPEIPHTQAFFESTNLLVSHEASLPIDEIGELADMRVHVVAGSRQASALRKLQESVPTLEIVEEAKQDELDLLEKVSTRRIQSAVVNNAIFDIASNYYPDLQASLQVGEKHPINWLLGPASSGELADKAEAFINHAKKDGTLERLRDRYFGHVERLKQGDSIRFIERIRTVLPQYRMMFQTAQASTGIDWRLLAALAYQESQWDPLATSATGVRGMMMLTEDTADHLGVSNRLDAKVSIRAGSQYLSDLREMLPDSVKEPDRLWLALAAYNLGMGHMNGARSIALGQKANPDSWYEMKKTLPLLARPQYYSRLKSGKARGGEAVIMVENIRVYADILSRYETPYRPLESSMKKKAGKTAAKSAKAAKPRKKKR